MDYIIEKYQKYLIHYNEYTRTIIIENSIPVEEFLKLKIDLILYTNIEVKNIIIGDPSI